MEWFCKCFYDYGRVCTKVEYKKFRKYDYKWYATLNIKCLHEEETETCYLSFTQLFVIKWHHCHVDLDWKEQVRNDLEAEDSFFVNEDGGGCEEEEKSDWIKEDIT